MEFISNIINKLTNPVESINVTNVTKLEIKPTQNHLIISKDQLNCDNENYEKFMKNKNIYNNIYDTYQKITSKFHYVCRLNDCLNRYFNKNYKFKLEKDDVYLKNIEDVKQFVLNCLNKPEKQMPFIDFAISDTINATTNSLFTINVVIKYDPFIALLRELHFENINAKITVMEQNDNFIFIPNNFMPTQCMAFIRDLIDSNICDNFKDQIPNQTFYSANCMWNDYTYNYYVSVKQHITNNNMLNSNFPILNTNKLFCVFVNDKDIYDSTSGLNFIEEISYEDLILLSTKCLNNNNYSIHSGFKVLNNNFFAGDGVGSSLCEGFIRFAKNKYSFMKKFGSAFACEGGFTFDYHYSSDPIYLFAKVLPMYTSSRTDLRGNNEFHRHYSTNLWHLFLLYFWLNEFGIKTTEIDL